MKNKFLIGITILTMIVVICILVKQQMTTNELKKEIGELQKSNNNSIETNENTENTTTEQPIENKEPTPPIEKEYMNGYEIMGNIEIPKTNVNLPILEKVTKNSLETSVAILYGNGLNKVGNTTIMGSINYFKDNKSLSNGDIIYITDQTKNKITYQIYDIFRREPADAEYMTRDTQGAREISLTTNDGSNTLIILAKEV